MCGLIALTLSSLQWAICKSFQSQHLHLVGLVLIDFFKTRNITVHFSLTYGRRFSVTGHEPCFVVVCMNCVWFMACHARANDIRSLRYLPCSSLRQLLMRRSPPFPSLSFSLSLKARSDRRMSVRLPSGLHGRWGSRETLSLLRQMGEKKMRQDVIRKSPLRRKSRNWSLHSVVSEVIVR